MRLKNKKTGEIIELAPLRGIELWGADFPEAYDVGSYDSLAELNEEWEDVPEEPKDKGYWYIDDLCRMRYSSELLDEFDDRPNNWMIRKLCGNYFDTREEAEKAVEKLKALTKLCKKGFEFNSVEMFGGGLIRIEASIPINEKTTLQERSNITDSLYLLFGGEE